MRRTGACWNLRAACGTAEAMPFPVCFRRSHIGRVPSLRDSDSYTCCLVFRVARARDIPVMVTFAGGYALRVEDTVAIHGNTVIAAKEVFSK